jgi:hypothetical protein
MALNYTLSAELRQMGLRDRFGERLTSNAVDKSNAHPDRAFDDE